MQSWGKQREVERVKEPVALSREQAKLIGDALNGAIGSALARLTGAAGERGRGPEPERKAGMTPLSGRPLDENGAIEFSRMTPPVTGPGADGYFEELYQKIKRRLIDECRVDPILLHLLTSAAPEMRIDVEPRVIELDQSNLRGRLAILIGAGWFDGVKGQAETLRELKRTGSEPHSGRLSESLASLVNDGALTREADGYQKAPGVKITKNVLTAV